MLQDVQENFLSRWMLIMSLDFKIWTSLWKLTWFLCHFWKFYFLKTNEHNYQMIGLLLNVSIIKDSGIHVRLVVSEEGLPLIEFEDFAKEFIFGILQLLRGGFIHFLGVSLQLGLELSDFAKNGQHQVCFLLRRLFNVNRENMVAISDQSSLGRLELQWHIVFLSGKEELLVIRVLFSRST